MSFAKLRLSLALRFAVVVASAAAAVGCQKFDMTKAIPWGGGEDGQLERPMKVVAVWTDTVLSQGMAPSTRGFGGRLMFYAAEDGKPVKARGTLTVYAFDETDRDIALHEAGPQIRLHAGAIRKALQQVGARAFVQRLAPVGCRRRALSRDQPDGPLPA
ncbi:MAG: hypothetical protein QM775_09915 [Pirellulales bacterium]